MSGSYVFYKEEVKEYLKSKFNEDAKILDVGPGRGTYYDLLYDSFKNIDAVEVFKPNIERFDLEEKYNKVYNSDIKDFKYDYYDVIIFGDVIEHLEIEEAQRVLEYAYNRCKEMIVAVPYCYPQGIQEDNIFEIHKQPDLTPENVLERYPMIKLLSKNDVYGYYVKK